MIGTILDNSNAEPVGPQMAEAVERLNFLPEKMKQVLGSAFRNSKLLSS